ncbi:MAG: UDP-N-acetylmuramoyl-tripeptide--D-alanyl-D-alanine ligase [Candidatus Paceibacterota bacterium]
MQIIKKIIVAILTLESRVILFKYRPFIVAITGSVGKTSAKDAIYAVLKNHSKYVRKSEKSMNSELGLPLTVIGVPNAWHNPREWLRNIVQGLRLIFRKTEYPDTLILEIGADHPGDIKKVAKWLHPHVAVITQVSRTPVHVEFFKSPEEVFEEKVSLIRAVRKGGTAVLLSEDSRLIAMRDELTNKKIAVVTYGTDDIAEVRGSEFSFEYTEYLKKTLVCRFKLNMGTDQNTVTYKNPLGRTGMYPLLAAAAVGRACGVSFGDIISGLGQYDAPKGRLNALPGINGSIVIDDTYNSSPDAVHAALFTLRELTCSGRKIAVLGDMLELGKYSAEEHRKVGREVAGVANILYTVGQRSRGIAEEAVSLGMSPENMKSFDSAHDAADFIYRDIRTGDIILVKGSQSMRMERVVKELLKDASEASTLLVRQEEEWLKKE